MRIKNWFKCELESSLLLHHTGISRKSEEIIKDQIDFINKSQFSDDDALKKVRDNAYKMKNALLTHSSSEIIEILNKSRKYKALTSVKIENDTIKERINFGFSNGADAAKVSGAGGGGFILFLLIPRRQYFSGIN